MFRKIFFTMCIITMLSLLTYGLTLAAGDLPTWTPPLTRVRI